MNLIEAVKSGKQVKRKDWGSFVNIIQIKALNMEHVLAEDWEVEEVKVTITAAEFDEAWQRAETQKYDGQWLQGFKAYIKKELGLG